MGRNVVWNERILFLENHRTRKVLIFFFLTVQIISITSFIILNRWGEKEIVKKKMQTLETFLKKHISVFCGAPKSPLGKQNAMCVHY